MERQVHQLEYIVTSALELQLKLKVQGHAFSCYKISKGENFW
jgi:hypothetical protein